MQIGLQIVRGKQRLELTSAKASALNDKLAWIIIKHAAEINAIVGVSIDSIHIVVEGNKGEIE